jgi:predicted TIM-barrel fold metal-dependent hydrolase
MIERIIDAHIHLFSHEGMARLCAGSGHQPSVAHLTAEFSRLNIRGAVVMGSSRGGCNQAVKAGLFDLEGPADPFDYTYPKNFGFCMGVNPEGLAPHLIEQTLADFRRVAKSPYALGFKLYPGYNHAPISDPSYFPILELAEELNLPVAVHTGDTANPAGRLRFAHPLTVDDAAAMFPRVQFVMCHFGNPWAMDAAEVCKNKPNVYADLSGLAVGLPDPDAFMERYRGYVDYLRTWLGFLDNYEKVMWGTDWPLVNLERYIELMAAIVPDEAHDQFFYQTAATVYHKLPALIEGSE